MIPERVQKTGTFFRDLQSDLCGRLEDEDGSGRFSTDAWKHDEEGGGLTRVIAGSVFEKGGVNTSMIATALTEKAAGRLGVAPQSIAATGISLILHPSNPFVPAVHANFRYLELANGDWWFGGGADLTPSYLFEDDARHFHGVWKAACDRHDVSYYPKFKAWCDRYFSLPHRGETRGVGGIFFDNLSGSFDPLFAFVRDCATAFADAYRPIVARRKDMPWTPEHRRWQLLRRGRYAEFNLLYDRGTRFGLETGGRTESILVSLPPEVRWDYNAEPHAGSDEERMLRVLRSPQSWTD